MITQPTLTLTEFLLARIAEDEAVARAAVIAAWDGSHMLHPELARWRYEPDGEVLYVVDDDDSWYVTSDSEGLSSAVNERCGPHIARHDPARVLAECEAKRRIVERAEQTRLVYEQTHELTAYTNTRIWQEAESVLRLLALPYADHPDWREEWRP